MLSQRQLFLQHVAQTSDFPLMLEIEKAEGIYLYDISGKKYIDLISGISVSNLGHRHPAVTKAILDQLDQYTHLMVYGEFIQSPQVELAKALSDTLPEELNSCYFVNSGSEAVEGAIKLAKRYTGKVEIISCKNAYHGSTHGSLSLSGNEKFKQAYRPLLPGIRHVEFGNTEELSFITEQTAAIIIEVVQGEAGVRVTNQTYWKKLRKKCDETGTLLIFDEIQTGYGRTGSFWAFDHYGIVPDILVCAKGMGGGLPLGAFISTKTIMDVLKNDPVLGHISTYGGHPVSAAASLATLNTILEKQLVEKVHEKAELFLNLLQDPLIKEIRNKGLLMAVEFESFSILKKIIDHAIKFGVITDWFLFCDNSMRIAPPLTISNHEIEQACDLIIKAIKKV